MVETFSMALSAIKVSGGFLIAQAISDIPLPDVVQYGAMGGAMVYAFRIVSKAKDATGEELKTQMQYLRDENDRLRAHLTALESDNNDDKKE